MSYVNEQRKLTQMRIEVLLKKHLPMDKDKAVSLIMYQEGMKKETAKEYIKVLFDNAFIGYNQERILIWKKKN